MPSLRLLAPALSALALTALPSTASAAAPVCAPASCDGQGASRTIVLGKKKAKRERTSLRVSVRFAPKGSRPRVTVTGPRGFKRVISKSRSFRNVRPGRYVVTAPAIGGRELTTYATYHRTRAQVRRGAVGWVGVRYTQRVASSTRVAAPSAIRTVTGDPSGERDVVVEDPDGLIGPGSVLAAGVGPQTPGGLLLAVTSVTRDGTRTIAHGGPAPLTAIGPQAEIAAKPQLTMSKAEFQRALAGDAGRSWKGLPRTFSAAKDKNGFQKPYKCSTKARATVDGSVSFDAGADVGVAWGGVLHPLTIQAYVGVKLKQSATLTVTIDGEAKCELGIDLLSKDYRFSSWTFSVGPVPVVIVPKLNFQVTGEASVGASLTTMVEQTFDTSFGVQWDGSKFGPYGKATASFKTYKPNPAGSLNVKAAVGPKLIFDFYDVAGPYLTADVFLQLKADTKKDPWWRLSGGLQAGGGLRFKVWKFDFDKNIPNIWSEDWTIAKADKPPVPSFTTTSLPDADNGKAYSAKVAASSPRGPLTYSVASGKLPDGIKLEASTGKLTGTATGYGTREFEVAAKDSLGQKGLRTFRVLTRTPAASIRTTALPGATTGVAYGAKLEAAGAVTPYTWSIAAGALPAGLRLTGDTISGTPTETGGATFTVRVRGVDGNEATRQLTLAVDPPPLGVATRALAAGKAYVAYDQALTATGGRAPYRWAAAPLPAGLTLDPAGRISGTPTGPFSAPVTLTVTDADGRTASAAVTLAIADVDPVAVATAALPQGMVGVAYTHTLTATGGRAPYTWTADALPAGLTLGTGGQLTGTPTDAGTVNVALTATDRDGRHATRTLALQVLPPGIELTTETLPAATVNEAYDETLTVLGGTAPYAWSVTDGSLPTGIGLDAATGRLSGTPTTGGSWTFTVKVAGSDGPSATRELTLVVDATVGEALTDVSCPTAETCVALDHNGRGYTWQAATGWSGAQDTTMPETGYRRRVSCPSETYCVAVSQAGAAAVYDGTAWSALPDVPGASDVFDVDCLTPTSCVAAGARTASPRSVLWTWDGADWTGPIGGNIGNGWLRVDCPEAGRCILTGNPMAGTFNGTTVTMLPNLSNYGESLACASTTRCFSGFSSQTPSTFDGTAWTQLTIDDGGEEIRLYPVGCARGANLCAGGGYTKDLWTWDGTDWTRHPGTTSTVNEIACAGDSMCVGVTIKGQARFWNGTAWSLPRTFARS
ncbi:MAG TPA: Ig domain-containing protein [Solirubrobacter sp.]|nr:Ig domain-containing protein [Solirubrobacter sp.]